MLTKWITSALRATAALALISGISAATASAQATDGYWQGVQKNGALRCGAAIAPPYIMRDPATGEYSGFFADLCKEFADVLKVKPQFVDTTWDNIVAGLQAGKWDISLALNRTPIRSMAVQFTIPAMYSQLSFAFDKNNPKVTGTPKSAADIDVAGTSIAVMSGTASDKAVTAAIKNATILRLPGSDEIRLALRSKRADFVADQYDSNQLFVQANPDSIVAFNPTPALFKQGVAFAVPRNLSAADVEVLNIFLEEEVATGHVDALIHKAVDEVLKSK